MAVIDFHSHILPGIDDGSKNSDMSIKMLEMAQEQGVEYIVATPHFYAEQNTLEHFLENRQYSYNRLMSKLPHKMPEIILGAEVAYFPGIGRAEGLEALTYSNTNILLLELPFTSFERRVLEDVNDLIKKRKFRVVLAHLERFLNFPGNMKYIDRFFDMPLKVQINAEAFKPFFQRQKIYKMFAQGNAHLLGSDCHNVESRKPNLQYGRDMLEKKFGENFIVDLDQKAEEFLFI